jgi:hypothetical protein
MHTAMYVAGLQDVTPLGADEPVSPSVSQMPSFQRELVLIMLMHMHVHTYVCICMQSLAVASV